MRKKSFLLEKFMLILILFRPYLTQVPWWMYGLGLLILLVYKSKKQGNTITVVILILASISIVASQLFVSRWMYLITALVVFLTAIFGPTVYYLPTVKPLVGFKQDILDGHYIAQFYPLNQQKTIIPYSIKWNHRNQMKRLKERTKKLFLLSYLIQFLFSHINFYNLQFGKGEDADNQEQLMIFSHGRGATPFYYSVMLRFLATKRRLITVQHNEKIFPIATQQVQIKKQRQAEVKERAKDIEYIFAKFAKNYKKVILIGHSYGGGTVVEAYHNLKNQHKHISLVLLDPWFFPLTQSVFNAKIKSQILMLSNQYFIYDLDIYQRNKKFIEIHKPTYALWKRADHLHQCDIPYIIGSNPFQKIKNAQMVEYWNIKNVEAIELFLEGKKGQIFEKNKNQIEDENFLPKQFSNSLRK